MNAFSNLDKLTDFIHQQTGFVGVELETAVMLYSAIYADLVTGSKAIGSYFMTRAEEAFYSDVLSS